MSDNPAPGWYPDPAGPSGHRYWDGATWTNDVAPASSAWGNASPTPPTGYGSYTPQTTELTGSGMRHIAQLFDDVGRIIKRAWLPILAISVLLWLGWLGVAAVVALSLIDLTRLSTALSLMFDLTQEYPGGTWPRSAQLEIENAFAQAIRTDSPWPYAVAAAILVVLSILVVCIQIAAVNRLAMDAAAGQPVSWRSAWRSGFVGGLRLFGYALALTAIALVAVAALIAVIALLTTASAAPLTVAAVLIALFAGLVWIVVAIWLTGRLAPITAQVDVAPHALGWTWRATRGKFWAVLGRYLLWSIVASIVGQIVLTVVLLPFSVLTAVATTNPTPATFAWLITFYAVSLPLTMAVSALTYIGIVPIWRDLTDDPTYRSIDDAGHLVTSAAEPLV